MSDEVAQEFQFISNGTATLEGPQVNFQNETSDPDECAKAANVTAMRQAEKTDFSLITSTRTDSLLKTIFWTLTFKQNQKCR